jgi:hypothetical protein
VCNGYIRDARCLPRFQDGVVSRSHMLYASYPAADTESMSCTIITLSQRWQIQTVWPCVMVGAGAVTAGAVVDRGFPAL